MSSLKGRVKSLEGGRKGRGMPIVNAYKGETTEEAWQKYLAQHPEAAGAKIIIVFHLSGERQDPLCAPPPPRPTPQERPKAPEPVTISITDDEDDGP